MWRLAQFVLAGALLSSRAGAQQDAPLLAASRTGDLKEVKRLIASGAPVDARDKASATPLMLAARAGKSDVVRELLAAKADPNAKDGKGLPVLQYAGGVAQPSIVADLIAGGARVDERDSRGDTPLLTAAGNGDPYLVEALVTHGADPNARDKAGNTPLIRCAWWTQYDVIIGGKEERHALVVETLLAHGANPNLPGQDGITALMRAAGWSHSRTLKALLEGGADPNQRDKKGRSALTWAARDTYRKQDYIQPLLAKGAKMGVTEALLTGDLKQARTLIEQGGDLSVRGGFEDTPLMIAAEWADLETVKALLRRKVDVNARDSDGNTALMIAAGGRPGHGQVGRYFSDHGVKKGRAAVVRALAQSGADLEARSTDWSHDTALSLAIDAKNMESAETLIAAGAKPDSHVEIYESPLELAASKGQDAVVLSLLKAGASARKGSLSSNVLGTVASTCGPDTLKALIRAGAPVNGADSMSNTPLMNAALKGKRENVLVLLAAGADVNRRNKDGNSALSIALEEAQKSSIAEILLKHGARVGLIEALLMGDRTKALSMIRSGANINIATGRDYRPLTIACEWADVEVVGALFKRGIKPVPSGRMLWSPLAIAACGRDEQVFEKEKYRNEWLDHGKRGAARIPLLKELLSHGADIRQSDELGDTALERASAKGDVEIMTFLMDHGADPNYAPPKKREFSSEGRLPLVSAADAGNLVAVKLLLDRGTKVNGIGSSETRVTPLSSAISNEHVEIVRLLLSKGADPSIRNWDGWTMMAIAKERKNQAIIDLLAALKSK